MMTAVTVCICKYSCLLKVCTNISNIKSIILLLHYIFDLHVRLSTQVITTHCSAYCVMAPLFNTPDSDFQLVRIDSILTS